MSIPTPEPLPGGTSALAQTLAGYRVEPGLYDELLTPAAAVRPRWQAILDGFLALGPEDRADAVRASERMLHDNDVLHIARDDPEQTTRPWRLDLFPFVLQQEEWQALEAGLIQRARVLNAALTDLYGEQRLLKEGILPPALVFGSPQFLPPCHGVPVPDGMHLNFIAFDLQRAPDGRWWVLSDRTEAPAGSGYALENRIVAARCLPELFNAANVLRLASFFQAFSDSLLAQARRDEPLAVVLSSGAAKETYYEHAYLARYLGYTLVEGSDLTVRDGRLYLKTVEGLKPVDIVLRRIASDLSDPLELRTDSSLGVPGLVQAARAGNVVIANALGSGLVQNEAMLSFLPGISRFLLDEELALPSIATWWCGQLAERVYVRENLHRLIVRKIFSRQTILAPGRDSQIGARLSPEKREALARQIAQRGWEYIGQEMVALSTTPVWQHEQGFRPAPMTLRVYVAATRDGYRVLPGGLARVAPGANPRTARLEGGEWSKDTWITATGAVDTFSLLNQPHHRLHLRRGLRDVPSRAADNLFWLGRYTERAEGAARLLRSLVLRLSGEIGVSNDPQTLQRLVSLLLIQRHLTPRRARRASVGGMRAVEEELRAILFDPESADGLAHVLANVRRTAELVRERLSHDTWRILRQLTGIARDPRLRAGQEYDDALGLLDTAIHHLAAFNGMVLENMTRGLGWRLLDAGRRLERVRHATRLVRHLATRDDPEGNGALDLLLELADSTMTYRTRYKARPTLPAALDLVLADDTNPRSVLFQLLAVEEHAGALPKPDDFAGLSPIERLVTGLRTDVQLADMVRLSVASGDRVTRVHLDRLARQIERGSETLSDLIAHTYFSHSTPRQVGGPHRLAVRG
jgi:uncharacterized circularly permuted ATP-grasp superfamily protein/uncharacterized alpha-E superfamily protein